MIDYCLFLITKFEFNRDEATENANSWWNKLVIEHDEQIVSFRVNKRGNPSIQTLKPFLGELHEIPLSGML